MRGYMRGLRVLQGLQIVTCTKYLVVRRARDAVFWLSDDFLPEVTPRASPAHCY